VRQPGNWRALRSWIREVPTSDPIDRRNAVTVQVLCLGLTVLLAVHVGASAVELLPRGFGVFLAEVPASSLSLAATLTAWWLIRRGEVRPAFWLVSGGMVLILSVSLVIRGYHYHQVFLLRTLGVVLALAALLLGRRALWICVAAIVAGCAIGALRDKGYLGGAGPLPLESPPLGMLGSTLLTLALFALVMDRFGSTLRQGFAALLDRQSRLEATARELEQKNQGLAEEITRRQQTEALLVEAQKLKAVGELSSGVAHDFNNLLTVVMGFADLAQRNVSPGSAVSLDLDEIRLAAQRGAELTRQLLAFARRQRNRPRRVQVESVVRGMNKLLQQLVGPRLQLRLELAPNGWTVRIDPAQFEQVLVNLVVNARDASPNGGTVTIATRRQALGLVRGPSQSLPPGDYVSMTVTDTGTGMDEHTRSRIFEPFFSTKPNGRGTGLGLAMCHGIVQQAGGAILVISAPDGGSSFEVLLPRVAGAPDVDEAELVPVGQGGSETILDVDDDLTVRAATVRLLRQLGYEVLEARDPDDAVAVVRGHQWPIHLVLSDVIMPGGGGEALVERVHHLRPGLRVLFMSGYAGEPPGRFGVTARDLPLLSKPFTSAELDRAIRATLEISSQPEMSSGI
jgi:signal transduction histidine kinase/ActR/RegA family two-component response regulator